jgi:outer membrane protein assembly factor BamB
MHDDGATCRIDAHIIGKPSYGRTAGKPMSKNWPFDSEPFVMSRHPVPPGMPGGFLSLSSKSGAPGTAILWATTPLNDDALHATVAGVVRAFDPATLDELWNSEHEQFLFAKYTPPTVANGKLFVPTFSGRVDVYGLR